MLDPCGAPLLGHGCAALPALQEVFMAKKSTTNKDNKMEAQSSAPSGTGPWISMRTGLIVIAITSIAMAVLTAWQAIPVMGFFQGILWGLFYGGMIWVIFFGFYLLNRFIRR
jgi:hypothetical protein